MPVWPVDYFIVIQWIQSEYMLKTHQMPKLTLNGRGPIWLGLTRSISWLLMPWLLVSPGHQQPWYWLYRIGRSLSYSRRNFNYLCLISVEEWHKMQIYVYVISEKIAHKGLRCPSLSVKHSPVKHKHSRSNHAVKPWILSKETTQQYGPSRQVFSHNRLHFWRTNLTANGLLPQVLLYEGQISSNYNKFNNKESWIFMKISQCIKIYIWNYKKS